MARALTEDERKAIVSKYSLAPRIASMPAWGFTVQTSEWGKVVVFRGLGNGILYFTAMESPQEITAAAEIDKPAYQSPDAGALAFLQGLAEDAAAAGQRLMLGLALVAGLVMWSQFRR